MLTATTQDLIDSARTSTDYGPVWMLLNAVMDDLTVRGLTVRWGDVRETVTVFRGPRRVARVMLWGPDLTDDPCLTLGLVGEEPERLDTLPEFLDFLCTVIGA